MTDLPPEISGVIGFYAGATNPSYEKSRGRKSMVAYHLSGESEAGSAGQKFIQGIPFQKLRCGVGTLAIGARSDNSADEVLYVPARALEGECKPIE